MISIVVLSSCNSSGYKKASEGFEYKIIYAGSGKHLQYGDYLQYHIAQRYINAGKDTMLGDSREYMPRSERLDSFSVPPAYLDILTHASKGDSVVIRIMTDSAYKDIATMPRHLDPGGYLYTTVRILNVFENADDADSAKRASFRANALKIYKKQLVKFEKDIEKDRTQIEADSKIIAAYLDKNKIQYIRGKWGTFIVIHEEGQGETITYNNVISVEYTGKTLDSGKVFDSNTDSTFNHLGDYEVTMSHLGEVIPGWTDALLHLKKGSKATVYIPSSLAYGKKGRPRKIKPNENIIYEITVKNVITEDRAMEIISENRRRNERLNKSDR
jgi:FKBP-type peptidyl-prolyl cis-trans isomerase